MVSLRFREFLTGYVAEEFDSLVAQLRSFFSISFNEDGTLLGIDLGLTSLPIGAVTPYAGATAPSGWLFCNGDAVSRITYKSLFEVVSTTYGAGDGSTTFNLPDLRQKFPLGLAASGTGAALGATGGAIDHTHTGPSHTHTGPSHTHTIDAEGDHAHIVASHAHTIPTQAAHDHAVTESDASATVGANAGAAGTDFFVAADAHNHAVDITVGGAHDHGGGTGFSAPDTSDDGAHDHGGATGSAGTGATGSSGTDATSATNPPFISLNFIILAAA